MYPSIRGAPRGFPFRSLLFTAFVLALFWALAAPVAAADLGWSRLDPLPYRPADRAADHPAREVAERLLDASADKGEVHDPFGDTFGGLFPQIDVLEMNVDLSREFAIILFRFTAPVSPGDSGASNAVVGYVDLDVDQNGATGVVANTDIHNPAGPLSGLGCEYYVDLFSYSSTDNAASVRDSNTHTETGRTPVLFAGSRMAIILDPAFIGGDDAAVDIAAVLGTNAEPTDVVPNTGSVPSNTSVLLEGGRFRTKVDWRFAPSFPTMRPARISAFRTANASNLYFHNPNNLEFLIKVLDGCSVNNHFWVFFAGATNVEFVITLEDLATHVVKHYFNAQGHPANAVTDTHAFATCP